MYGNRKGPTINPSTHQFGRRVATWLILTVILGGAGRGHTGPTEPSPPGRMLWGPYFLGHETEPSMDYGGRVMVSLHRAATDLGASLTDRFPFLAPVYEFPLALVFYTLQHEIHGHGSRGREYNLKPRYGFGLDFSAYTSIDRDPETLEQLSALASGGTEATGIMARRMLLDACRPGTIPASGAPLMLMAKLDLSLYTAITPKPRDKTPSGRSDDDDDSFVDAYEQGNDIAIYLATRQALRRQADPVDVWHRDYRIDFDEAMLETTYRQVQDAAIWNALDPMMWATLFFYVTEHAVKGVRTLPAPAVPLGNGFGFTAGTRGSIEPQSVSRFLDLYLLTPIAVFGAYGRDLRSVDHTAYGFGAGVYRMTLGPRLTLSLAADFWEHPDAPEALYDGVGWNASGEVDLWLHSRIGLSLKTGGKNAGYFPGAPTTQGLYFGGGVTARF